jgi:hypothetical protein
MDHAAIDGTRQGADARPPCPQRSTGQLADEVGLAGFVSDHETLLAAHSIADLDVPRDSSTRDGARFWWLSAAGRFDVIFLQAFRRRPAFPLLDDAGDLGRLRSRSNRL